MQEEDIIKYPSQIHGDKLVEVINTNKKQKWRDEEEKFEKWMEDSIDGSYWKWVKRKYGYMDRMIHSRK